MVIARELEKVFLNGHKALDKVSFFIDKGEFVFLVGQSGAGKTTLIKLLLREEIPTSGELSVNRVNVANLSRKEIPFYRRNIGVVFQDFRLLPSKTVYENVEFAMDVVGASAKEKRRRIPLVLNQVGLTNKAKQFPGQLSGGEQQRVAIARAIVNAPSVLIADEPTGNLDPDTAWEIIESIEQISKRGTTVIMATHAKEIVNIMKKRVIALDGGCLVRDEEKGVYRHEC